MSRLMGLVLDEDGQDLVEYGLLAAFIALAVIASIDGVARSAWHDISVPGR